MLNVFKNLIFLLGGLFATSGLAAPKIWDGTADVSWYESSAQAYNLTTAEQLAGLATLVNNGNTFAGKTITLGADIFLNDTAGVGAGAWANITRRSWTPIGTNSHPFKGEFDGIAGKKNRKIYGLYFNDTTKSNVGLFGYTNGVKISNLDLPVGRVSASNNTGALVGYAELGAITNVHSKVKVIGKNKVGGLVGYFTGSLDRVTVQENVTGQDSVGGVVGYTSGSISGTANDYSFFMGNVNGRSYVGGLAGYAQNSIRNSLSEGYVSGKKSFVGGLVGYATSSITGSYSEGDVTGVSYVGGLVGCGSSIGDSYHEKGNVSGESYVGGLVGYANSSITGSYSKGGVIGTADYIGGLVGMGKSIKASYHEDGNVIGRGYVGGLAGYATDSVTDSHSEGDVTGTADYVGGLVGHGTSIGESYHEKGNVSGKGYVGGLAGYAGNSVTDSHSEGDVTGTANYVGGLIGLSYYFYSGSAAQIIVVVDRSYSIGNVKGVKYVGGLVGLDSIYRPSENTYRLERLIKRSYAQGAVVGTLYTGGVLGKSNFGYKSSSYSSNFYSTIDSVSHTNGSVDGESYVGGLVGYTYGTVSGSYSEGDVTGTANYVGGLVGRGSSIETSYHEKGNVSGKANVGGLAGASSLITDSHSEGDVKGSADHIGGLVGQTYGRIERSYSEGNVTGTKDYVGGLVGFGGSIRTSYHKKGYVSGKGYVGGLAGYTSDPVMSSYSEGDVIGTAGYIGGLTGYARDLITTSHSEGNVSGNGYVGGLTGYAQNSVKGSHSEGFVTGTGDNVGGLIGSGSVDSCYHIGDVVGTGNYVGGLIGSGTVSNSYSEGNVSGLDCVGGIAGSSSKIRNSYAKVSFVKGRNSVGGLSGYVTDSIDVTYSIADSVIGIFQVGGIAGYSKSVVDSSYSTANVKGDDNVGGLIGSAYGNVSNSYAIGNVVGDVEHSSAGNDNLGGLVGYQYDGSVSKSMALGNVSGTTKLGGLVGRFEGKKITQSYANGNVTGDYYGDPADEVGNYYIGGLVGFAKGSIDESYASGIVKGIEDEPVYTGCLVGFVNGSLSVTKSYYDKNKCNLGIDGGENSVSLTGKPDKTTEEMRTQSTFENWDFTDTWMMMENTYPFLQFYVNSLLNAVVLTESLDGIVYDGSAKSPLVTKVKLWGTNLLEGVDYSVSYENNVNAGNAKIKVCGLNLYNGCKIIPFEIEPVVIKPTIAAVDNITYTGYALIPEISAYNGETLLSANEYVVEYKDNINVGTATVTMIMKGNFKGTASSSFKIEKATPVISQNPKASDIVIGEILSLSELTDGKANIEGEFVWKNPSVKPSLENDGYAVVFIPKDSENYMNSAEIIVPVKVFDVAYIALHVGKATIDSTVVVKGGNYTLPEAPDSIGYDFDGYYNGKVLVGKFGEEIVVNENIVLEAIYQIKKFEVTFLNGNVKLQSNEVAYGEMPEYFGESPSKAATAQYTYLFNGWSPELKKVTESVSYAAVFENVLNKYEIRFVNGAETYQSDSVYYGDLPEYKGVEIPTKISTDKYDYVFNGWTPAITSVTGAKTYTAAFRSVMRKYTITFINGTTTLQTSDIAYGTKPSYTGITPTMASTEKYDYKFKGWTPSLATVTGVATYTAVFDSSLRKYSVTFKNETTTLQTSDVSYGSSPSYTGDTPAKSSTEKYDYTFKGWNPTITTVTGAATYTAVFDSTLRKYAVTFKNGSTPLQTSEALYGSKPSYTGNTPTKASTEKYDYTFNGWNPTITSVTGATTYTAVFDSTLRKYAVTFKNGSTLLQTSEVLYGSKPSYTGDSPTKVSTEKYDYTFKGWNPTITSVSGAATYTAVFDSTLRKYIITFKNGSTTLQTSEIAYGSKPSYTGDTPIKASDKYTYKFKGWNPAIATVTKAATYQAVFDSTLRKYTITFKNGSTTLQTSEVAYGSKPSYTGSTPTKKATNKYSYKFKGWNPAIATVTKAATYQAVFDSTKVTGIIENRLASLDVTVRAVSRSIQISAAPKNSTYAVLDMQGRVLLRGRAESSNFNIAVPRAGCYLVRVGNATRKVQVK